MVTVMRSMLAVGLALALWGALTTNMTRFVWAVVGCMIAAVWLQRQRRR